MSDLTVGSICSGIEAASVAWLPLGMDFKWFSEIEEFPSSVLKKHYPNVPNLGDMTLIPDRILNREINAPDLLCGGTPCQAFSLAGWKKGLEDDRGNLTLSFVDIVEANDKIREMDGKKPSIVFWENVVGVLSDKTNAFGSLVSSLAGLDTLIENSKWPNSGILRGPKRNIAWRVLDAKHFGLPQQRKRVYLIAGGKDFNPEEALFEFKDDKKEVANLHDNELEFTKDNVEYEVFRKYTDCLYSAYGTKWNGNAAAYNGSLFVIQNERIRRLSPLECERLMGLPDDYTNLEKAKRTPRYQAIGNSWAVPVIEWLGKNIIEAIGKKTSIVESLPPHQESEQNQMQYWNLDDKKTYTNITRLLNVSEEPNDIIHYSMKDVVDQNPPKSIYISPVGCFGMIRRKNERNLKMNKRLEEILLKISSEMSPEEIEKRSRKQKRGRLSEESKSVNLTLFT